LPSPLYAIKRAGLFRMRDLNLSIGDRCLSPVRSCSVALMGALVVASGNCFCRCAVEPLRVVSWRLAYPQIGHASCPIVIGFAAWLGAGWAARRNSPNTVTRATGVAVRSPDSQALIGRVEVSQPLIAYSAGICSAASVEIARRGRPRAGMWSFSHDNS
jgi:hypothetical protein